MSPLLGFIPIKWHVKSFLEIREYVCVENISKVYFLLNETVSNKYPISFSGSLNKPLLSIYCECEMALDNVYL